MEPNIAQTLITATLGGGGTVALFGLIKSLIDKFTGKADRVRQENRDTMSDFRQALKTAEEKEERAEQRADAARRRTDEERALRIQYQELYALTRHIALSNGVPLEALPTSPSPTPSKE